MHYDYLIVGSGLYGSIFAYEAKKRYNGYIENYFVKKNPEFMFMPATVEEMVHF